jgi:GNAT superfamily N-acetyltransferase
MITAQKESFRDRLPEFSPLFPLHYEELALNKDKVPLDPQYNIYLDREDAGELLFVTLRELGEPVGYFIGFISPALHYKTCLTCIMDIFYVHPDKRGSGGGQILFNFVEKELKRRGVERWFVGSKLHKDSSYLFEKLGFDKVEVYYSKWLGD